MNAIDLSESISYEGIIYSSEFEEKLINDYYVKDDKGPIHFDLSRIEYLDIVAAQNLIAQCARIANDERERLIITPPKSEDVISFLSTWDFEKAFYGGVGKELNSFINDELFEEYNKKKETLTPDYGIDEEILNYKSFFPFQSFQKELFQKDKGGLVLNQISTWSEETIISILNKHLLTSENNTSKSGDYFPGRIIYESITNALRHPNCDVIQTASRFYNDKNHFTIVFWDNGESIMNTLKSFIYDPNYHQALNKILRQSIEEIKISDIYDNFKNFLNTLTFNLRYDELSFSTNFRDFETKRVWKNRPLNFR